MWASPASAPPATRFASSQRVTPVTGARAWTGQSTCAGTASSAALLICLFLSDGTPSPQSHHGCGSLTAAEVQALLSPSTAPPVLARSTDARPATADDRCPVVGMS